jgi:prevent-host-death family protein
MEDVTLASAKARLSELVERAARGESIRITRRGKPVAQLLGVEGRRKPVDLAVLQALTRSMSKQAEPARDWLRELRDDQRY